MNPKNSLRRRLAGCTFFDGALLSSRFTSLTADASNRRKNNEKRSKKNANRFHWINYDFSESKFKLWCPRLKFSARLRRTSMNVTEPRAVATGCYAQSIKSI